MTAYFLPDSWINFPMIKLVSDEFHMMYGYMYTVYKLTCITRACKGKCDETSIRYESIWMHIRFAFVYTHVWIESYSYKIGLQPNNMQTFSIFIWWLLYITCIKRKRRFFQESQWKMKVHRKVWSLKKVLVLLIWVLTGRILSMSHPGCLIGLLISWSFTNPHITWVGFHPLYTRP